jgi:N utilization substance protein B
MSKKVKQVYGRHGSRWVALQGLYAWQLSGNTLQRIEEDLLSGLYAEKSEVAFNKAYLHELLVGVINQVETWDALMLPYLDRPLLDLNPVEQAILRIAFYELKMQLQTPYRVIINEAVLLACEFGAQEGHRFVNGVLDKAVRALRPTEINQRTAVSASSVSLSSEKSSV